MTIFLSCGTNVNIIEISFIQLQLAYVMAMLVAALMMVGVSLASPSSENVDAVASPMASASDDMDTAASANARKYYNDKYHGNKGYDKGYKKGYKKYNRY